MPEPAPTLADQAAEAHIHPDMPCFVAGHAASWAAVEAGMASARAGRVFSLDQVEAELRQVVYGPGWSGQPGTNGPAQHPAPRYMGAARKPPP